MKFLYQRMNPSSKKHSAKGWGSDLSFLKSINNNIYFGIIIQDVGSYLEWDTGWKDKLPLDIRGGLGIRLLKERLNLCLDLEKIKERSNLKPHLGVEYWFSNTIGMRVGLNSKNPTAGFSLGLPIKSTNLKIDYAFSPDTFTAFNEVVDKYNHRFSLSLKF